MKKLSITLTGLLLVNSLFAQVAISEKDFTPTNNSYDNLVIKDYRQVSSGSWNILSNSSSLLSEKEMYVSYCQEAAPYLRLPTETYDMASYFDKMLIGKYVGDKITKIRVAMGAQPKALTIWLREKLDKEPVFSKEITGDALAKGWIEVELPTDKAYTITEEGYYVGYTITQKKVNADDKTYYPIAITGDGTLLEKTLLCSEDNGKNWDDYTTAFMSAKVVAVLGVQTAIASDNHSDFDLALTNFKGDTRFIKRDKESGKAIVAFNGYVFNSGKEPINSFDFTVSAHGIESKTSPIKINGGLKMFRGAMIKGSVEVPNNVPSTVINLKASNIDEGSFIDERAENNEINTENIYFYEQDTIKTALVEMYTTAKCPNCPYGHKVIEALPKDCNKALVAHHVGFDEDNFTIQDSYDYMYAFGVRGAPNATADRTFIPENNGVAFSLGYTNAKQGAEAVMKNLAFTESALPAFASIRATAGYDESSRELTVKVSGRKVNAELFDIAMKQPRVNVYLTEDGLVGVQSGASSKYVHDHVLREILGDVWGKEVTWNGDIYTAEFKTTINEQWNIDKMNLIAFLSDEAPDSRYFHNAMNAIQIPLNKTASSINQISSSNIQVEIKDKAIQVIGDYNTYNVYNIQGMQIQNSCLENGIYLVRIQTDNKVIVHKVTID